MFLRKAYRKLKRKTSSFSYVSSSKVSSAPPAAATFVERQPPPAAAASNQSSSVDYLEEDSLWKEQQMESPDLLSVGSKNVVKPYDFEEICSLVSEQSESMEANEEDNFQDNYQDKFDVKQTKTPYESNQNPHDAIERTTTSTSTTVEDHTSEDSDTVEASKPPRKKGMSRAEKNRRNLVFWEKVLDKRLVTYGVNHVRIIEALMNLGMADMRCELFERSQEHFSSAIQIIRTLYGQSDLREAKALDRAGHALSRSCRIENEDSTAKHLALQALNAAFRIRYEKLGPDHVDTVETLNKIAGINMKLGNFQESREGYEEVLVLRKAMFGANHPCVGVTAHALASTLMRLSKDKEAKIYFEEALNAFAVNGMGTHPFAEKMRRQLDCLGFHGEQVEL